MSTNSKFTRNFYFKFILFIYVWFFSGKRARADFFITTSLVIQTVSNFLNKHVNENWMYNSASFICLMHVLSFLITLVVN